MERNRKRLAEEEEKIDQYLESDKIDSRILTSGLRYVILKAGEEDYPEIKEKVSVHYTGKLLDGKVFDTSPGELAKESGLFNESMSYKKCNPGMGHRYRTPEGRRESCFMHSLNAGLR